MGSYCNNLETMDNTSIDGSLAIVLADLCARVHRGLVDIVIEGKTGFDMGSFLISLGSFFSSNCGYR
jgi:hypothetical protein